MPDNENMFNLISSNVKPFSDEFNGEDISLDKSLSNIKKITEINNFNKPNEIIEYTLNEFGGIPIEETKKQYDQITEYYMQSSMDDTNPFYYNEKKF